MLDWIKIMDSTHKIKEMPNDALLVRINLKKSDNFSNKCFETGWIVMDEHSFLTDNYFFF